MYSAMWLAIIYGLNNYNKVSSGSLVEFLAESFEVNKRIEPVEFFAEGIRRSNSRNMDLINMIQSEIKRIRVEGSLFVDEYECLMSETNEDIINNSIRVDELDMEIYEILGGKNSKCGKSFDKDAPENKGEVNNSELQIGCFLATSFFVLCLVLIYRIVMVESNLDLLPE